MEWFISLCKWASKNKIPKLFFNKPISEEEKLYLEFRGWKLTEDEYRSGQSAGVLISFAIGIFLAIYLYIFMQDILINALEDIWWVPIVLTVIIPPIGAFFFFSQIYKTNIEYEILHRSCELPEFLGYISVYLKLVPNMERAVEYAISATTGYLSDKFKELIWKTRLGLYTSIEEAIDILSYKWGQFIPEFRFTLMKIRSSIVEKDNTKRELILDQAINYLLESVKYRLLLWADSLKMPATMIFFVGVFLPLLLMVLLPIGSFTGLSLLSNPYIIGLGFDLLLPLLIYSYMSNIIENRPKFFSVPKIKLEFDQKEIINAGIVFLIIAGGGCLISYFILHPILDTTPEKISEYMWGDPEKYKYVDEDTWESIISSYDTTPYILALGCYISIALGVAFVIKMLIKSRLEEQKNYMEMEKELTSSIYFLASRLAEFKPLEECLIRTTEIMKRGHIKDLFERIVYNIKYLGLTLEEALFNKVFGVLVNIPSEKIKHIMKVVAESTYLGPEQAAKNLMSIATQLQNQQQVMENIYRKTEEITSTMIIMALFILPLILGISTGLEKIIFNITSGIDLSNMMNEEAMQYTPVIANMFSHENEETTKLDPLTFMIITMIYIVEIDVLICYFVSSLQTGFDWLQFLDKFSNVLPISAIVFSVVVVLVNMLIGGMIGFTS